MKNLSERALLVNIKISQWTGKKYDKKVSQEIEKEHNAHDAGRFNKTLIAEKGLKDIKAIASQVRSFHYDNTLPWGDNGDRLLPVTNYFEFGNKMRVFTSQFNEAVKVFIRDYDNYKGEAKIRLNGMFQESDYPNIHDMQQKFGIGFDFIAISDLEDFRLEVDQNEVSALKQQMEERIKDQISTATKNIWERMKEAIGHMVDKLSDKDAIFRDSLVTNIQDLIDVLPRLNITEDKEIDRTIESMRELLVDPDLLRTNSRTRQKKAKEAKLILDKINDFL